MRPERNDTQYEVTDQRPDRAFSNSSTRATALGFDPEADAAPRLLAAGEGNLAQAIVSVAESSGVPIVQDPGLSRLLEGLPVGAEIPVNLHRAVAAVFGLIYRLEREQAAGRGPVLQPDS